MPNKQKVVITTQGQAWDQIARREYGRETMLGVLLPENVEQMDTLLFSGEVTVNTPDAPGGSGRGRVRTLPPWERM